MFEPLDFIARLAALVPKPRVHLTRYHGVFAPHSALRAQVTPAGRGKKTGVSERSPAERHRAMTWAQRLKRVFRIDIESCGGKVRIIASVEDPAVIGRILAQPQAGISRSATDCYTTRPRLPQVAGFAPGGYTGSNMGFERPIRSFSREPHSSSSSSSHSIAASAARSSASASISRRTSAAACQP
jgi:hypothetical protein